MSNKIIALVASCVIIAGVARAATGTPANGPESDSQVARKVRKELVTLPFYGVFDNLAFDVKGDTVTLYGQVIRPVTKKDAEHRVKKIRGVGRVINNIEVLPLSPFDDSIRRRTLRTLANTGGLFRYFLGANPSIHIIVKNGRVTLEGVVANQGDRDLAYIAANGVSEVFGVTNNLRVENSSAR